MRFPNFRRRAASVLAFVAVFGGDPAATAADLPAWWSSLAPAFSALMTAPVGRVIVAEREARTAAGRAAGAPMDPMLEVGVEMLPLGDDLMLTPMAQMPMIGLRQRWSPVGLAADRRRGAREGEAAAAMAEADFDMRAMRLAEWAFLAGRWRQELAVVDRIGAWLRIVASTAASRYGGGMGDASEAARLEAQLAAIETERASIVAELAALGAAWAAMLPGTSPPLLPEVELERPAWRPAPATAVVAATPLIRAAHAKVAAADAELAMRRGAWVPELEVGLRYGVREGDDAVSATLGVGLPIWGARRQAPQVDAARARLAGAEAERVLRRLEIEAHLEATAARLAAVGAREQSLRQVELPALATARAAAWEAYRAGHGQLMQVLDAAEREWMSERTLATQVAERRMLEATWLATAGRLMPRKDEP